MVHLGKLLSVPLFVLLISSKLSVLLSLLLFRTSHKVDKKTSFPEMHENIENFSLLVQKREENIQLFLHIFSSTSLYFFSTNSNPCTLFPSIVIKTGLRSNHSSKSLAFGVFLYFILL